MRSIFPPSIPNILISDEATEQSQLLWCSAHRSHTGDTDIRTIDIVDSGPQLDAATAPQQPKQECGFHKAIQPGSPISVLLCSAREPLLVSKSPLRMSHHASENRPPTNALLHKLSVVTPTSSAPPLSTGSTPFPVLPSLNDEDVARSVATVTTEKLRPRLATGAGTGMPPPPKKDVNANYPARQPLQMLPTLQEEQDEAHRQYDLASQNARIISQMAGDEERNRHNARGKEHEQWDRRDHSQHIVIPVGKGLAEDKTQSIKPIRETPRKHVRRKTANGRLPSYV